MHVMSTGAQLGTFEPFEIGDEEIVLTGLWLDKLDPSCRILLRNRNRMG